MNRIRWRGKEKGWMEYVEGQRRAKVGRNMKNHR